MLSGEMTGRRNEKDITLFELLGQATEDLVAATYVFDAIRRKQLNGI